MYLRIGNSAPTERREITRHAARIAASITNLTRWFSFLLIFGAPLFGIVVSLIESFRPGVLEPQPFTAFLSATTVYLSWGVFLYIAWAFAYLGVGLVLLVADLHEAHVAHENGLARPRTNPSEFDPSTGPITSPKYLQPGDDELDVRGFDTESPSSTFRPAAIPPNPKTTPMKFPDQQPPKKPNVSAKGNNTKSL